MYTATAAFSSAVIRNSYWQGHAELLQADAHHGGQHDEDGVEEHVVAGDHARQLVARGGFLHQGKQRRTM